MAEKTTSFTRPALHVYVLVAAFMFATGCGNSGPDNQDTHDTLHADVAEEVDLDTEHDEGIADTGRDEQAAETTGDTSPDTAGDVDNPPDVQDADQDTHVPSGVVETLPEMVDFFCGEAKKVAVATLTVKNTGDADLSVTSISVADPACDALSCLFSITALQLHDPDGSISTGTGPVAPGGWIEVELKFELLAPDTGENSANLRIVSDSTVNPLVIVPMVVTVIPANGCRLEMVPGQIDFGIVPVGFPKMSSVSLINTGTTTCRIDSAKIADCNSDGDELICPDPLTGEDSTVFTIPAHVNVVGMTAGPGQAASVPIVYTPPIAGEDTTTYSAILSVGVADLAGEGYVLPSCVGECAPNLGGAIVLDTNVYPQAVDFGLVRSGCGTRQAKVCYYNTAEAATLVKVDASQCGTEFHFDGISENWDSAFKGIPWCIDIDYQPTDAGTDTCTVLFNEYGTPVTSQEFTLTGEGSAVDGVTDTFTGHSGQTEFDISGIPVSAGVVVKINDFDCSDWSVGGTDLDATIILGESCPVEHLDEVEISYDLECLVQ